MRCRQTVDGNTVWFGSIGIDAFGKRKKLNGAFPENYVSELDALLSSLNQRLTVIKGELWYQVNLGLPLVEKIQKKDTFDFYISSLILGHPDVMSIKSFFSQLLTIEKSRVYRCDLLVVSRFGELPLEVQTQI